MVLRLGVKKSLQLSFWISKKFCSALWTVLSWLFLNMKWVQNATIRSPIGAPDVVWRDVKHVWIFGEILWSCWLIWQNRSRISIVAIQVTKSNFRTTATSKKVSPNNSNNERQPEIAIWPPKKEILISLELWQIASKFQRQFWDFRPWRVQRKCSQMIATTTDNRI